MQEANPVGDDLADLVSHREEPGRDGLGEFGAHLPRILNQSSLLHIHVLEFERRNERRPERRSGA